MIPVRHRWRGLLVSVRDADEAAEALAGGAAIVDVKDPAQGPLGAAVPAAVAAVATAVGDRAPWTLACGELAADAVAMVRAALAALPAGAALPAAAKAGPAGLEGDAWRDAFSGFAAALPQGVEPVAVAYADWRAARTSPPAVIVAAAALAGCRTLLVDTFDKAAAGILAANTATELPACIARAHALGMDVAVAGRLACADVARVVSLGADVVAVRSAACRGGRLGRVDRGLVAAVAATLADTALGRPAIPAECPEP